jgi:hypothetical protein
MRHRIALIAVIALIAGGSAALVAVTNGGGATAPASSSASLDAKERAALVYIREEEKLARDVYRAMIRRYGARPFTNIASAEERHMSAVKVLLDRYGVADPAAGRAEGRFADPALQKLHDRLVAKGLRSLDDAMQVGVLIERTDIADITDRLDEVQRADIRQVFMNLRDGSERHLEAFQRWAP